MVKTYLDTDKGLIVSASQVTRENAHDVAIWCGGEYGCVPNPNEHPSKADVFVLVPNGKHPPLKARPGDFVYRVNEKKFSVSDAEIFTRKHRIKEVIYG